MHVRTRTNTLKHSLEDIPELVSPFFTRTQLFLVYKQPHSHLQPHLHSFPYSHTRTYVDSKSRLIPLSLIYAHTETHMNGATSLDCIYMEIELMTYN